MTYFAPLGCTCRFQPRDENGAYDPCQVCDYLEQRDELDELQAEEQEARASQVAETAGV